jgi:hypothetical protein
MGQQGGQNAMDSRETLGQHSLKHKLHVRVLEFSSTSGITKYLHELLDRVGWYEGVKKSWQMSRKKCTPLRDCGRSKDV